MVRINYLTDSSKLYFYLIKYLHDLFVFFYRLTYKEIFLKPTRMGLIILSTIPTYHERTINFHWNNSQQKRESVTYSCTFYGINPEVQGAINKVNSLAINNCSSTHSRAASDVLTRRRSFACQSECVLADCPTWMLLVECECGISHLIVQNTKLEVYVTSSLVLQNS